MRLLWAKLNNRMFSQFECDMAWFSFCFDFGHSHLRYHLGRVERRGICLKLVVQGQGDRKILNVDELGVGGLGNWTIFMEVICVSFLKQ